MLYLRFTPSPAERQVLEELERARNEIDSFLDTPEEYLGALRRHAIAESVHFSTRIEGNTLTFEQVENVLRGAQVTAPPDQIQEVRNYDEAMAYTRSIATGPRPRITEETIKTIHFLVTKSLPGDYNPGHYRRVRNAVIDRVTGRRLFQPPPVESVEPLMEEYVRWLDTSQRGLHPYHRAALAHLNFIAIHPFIDGNGRTARIIETLVLYLAGYRSQELVSLEAYFGRDTQGYYHAIADSLGAAYQPEERDVTRWVAYYLGAHAQQARAAVATSRTTDAQVEALWDAFADQVSNSRAMAFALWFACRVGAITNSAYREVVKVGNQTAAKHLAQMVDAGLLTRRGRGRGTEYAPADEVWDVYDSAVVEE